MSLRQRTALRVLLVVAGAIVVLFPYRGAGPPDRQLLSGPLLLLVTRSPADRAIGVAVAAAALSLVSVFVARPSARTAPLLVLAGVIWIGFAVFLSYLYAM